MTQQSNLISTDELEQYLGREDVRILDCRFDLGDPQAGRRAYEEGHIRGAVFADLDSDLSSPVRPDSGRHPLPDVDHLAATLGHLGIDDNMEVIVYDAGPGALAARAWWLLRWMGHQRVRLLDGGIQSWLANARPVVAGSEHVEYRRFQARPCSEMIVTTEELCKNVDAISRMNLIDARDAVRYQGAVEPIDSVAGHIPGSRNVPYSLSLNDAGHWKPRAQLESLWSRVIGDNPDTRWIAMCGSGVTACHLAISALEAGFPEPRLYVGSWSEWIRDPARPVAVGDESKMGNKGADLS